jgi:1,2-diacylglycerol 3-alpha-glucosyltransferase
MISGCALVVQRLAEGLSGPGLVVLVLAASDRQRAYVDHRDGLTVAGLRSFRNPWRAGQCFVLWPRREVVEHLQTFCPNVLHLQDPICAVLCGPGAARNLDFPVLLSLHQLHWFASAYLPRWPILHHGVEGTLWRYANWLLAQCEAVIAPSHTIAKIASTHCRRHVQVISNGVDLERFGPNAAFRGENEALCRKSRLDAGTPVMLHVGRIDVDKRVDLVVRAAAKPMRSTKVQLLVVGDGIQRSAAIPDAQFLGEPDRCCFPSFVPPGDDLSGLYRLAPVFVTASEIETQGLVILEAAASGLPVVVVRTAALPEAVQDGITGYLVVPGDTDAMADRIARLLQDLQQASGMGRAGRHMMERHSLGRSIEAHEQVYRSIVNTQERRHKYQDESGPRSCNPPAGNPVACGGEESRSAEGGNGGSPTIASSDVRTA